MTTTRRNRRFGDDPKTRLVISIEELTVAQLDQLIRTRGEGLQIQGNRSEFVRQAIEEKMQRECA